PHRRPVLARGCRAGRGFPSPRPVPSRNAGAGGLPPVSRSRREPRKTVFSRSNRDLFLFVMRYRTMNGAGNLQTALRYLRANGLRFHYAPVFRGSPQGLRNDGRNIMKNAGTIARYAKSARWALFAYLAEREGFEPSIRETRIPDFESGAFDHSATSPKKFSTRRIGSCRRRICSSLPETHPSLRSGPACRLSKFVPDEFVDHSATSPKIRLFPRLTLRLGERPAMIRRKRHAWQAARPTATIMNSRRSSS